jgi:hypothetical protein
MGIYFWNLSLELESSFGRDFEIFILKKFKEDKKNMKKKF